MTSLPTPASATNPTGSFAALRWVEPDEETEFDYLDLTDADQNQIKELTGLETGWLGDHWWIHVDGNPVLSWPELIDLAVGVLGCRLTERLYPSLYRAPGPTGIVVPAPLVERVVSGAKRVNASSGQWHDFSGLTGAKAMEFIFAGGDLEAAILARAKEPQQDTGDLFRLSGKDESCLVEGTWFDWCCLACNVLASQNTANACPEVYAPHLKNDHY